MTLLRTYIERLSRGRTFWRRLPEPFSAARVRVTPDASLACLKLSSDWCDEELLGIVSRYVKPGDAVWDVGANLGIFGIAAAVRSGQSGFVLCVEPDLFLVQLIRQSARRLNGQGARLQTLAAAVGAASGIAEFCIAERGRASNSLAQFGGRSQMGGVRERQLVPVVSLDELLQHSPAPAVVKVDVEGAEAVIFEGAARLLGEIRPVIYVEVGTENIEKVSGRLHEFDYGLFDPSRPPDASPPLERCVWNTLAIPRKR